MVKRIFRCFKNVMLLLYYIIVMPEKRFNKFPYIEKYKGRSAIVFGNGPSTRCVLDRHDIEEVTKGKDLFFVNYAAMDSMFFKLKPKHFFLSDFVFSRDTNDYRGEMTRRMYNILEKNVDWDLSIYLCFTRKKYCDELVVFSKIRNPHIHFVYLNRKHCSGLSPMFRHWLYRKGWFMPEEGTVVNTAIYVALIEGYKKIELYGVEHNMFLNLRLNDDHQLCIIQRNFYDIQEKFVPVKIDGCFEQSKVHNYMYFIYVMFRSHYLLRQFADYMRATIINCTPDSMIDVYEFK
ncbi:MAG: hypothetical protein J6W13_02075 [Salinivirgaceae bacterium]|nr:hypothetical protein [Salinivirgaceae bacterium]